MVSPGRDVHHRVKFGFEVGETGAAGTPHVIDPNDARLRLDDRPRLRAKRQCDILAALGTLARQSPDLVDEIDLRPAYFADCLPTSGGQQQHFVDVPKRCWQLRGCSPKSPDLVITQDAAAGFLFLRSLDA